MGSHTCHRDYVIHHLGGKRQDVKNWLVVMMIDLGGPGMPCRYECVVPVRPSLFNFMIITVAAEFLSWSPAYAHASCDHCGGLWDRAEPAHCAKLLAGFLGLYLVYIAQVCHSTVFRV